MKALNWTAIGMGVAVCVAAWIVVVVIGTLMPAASSMTSQLWLNRSIGMGSRFAGGFMAGWMSGERGVEHGLWVGILASVATNLLSIGWMVTRSGAGVFGVLPGSYWLMLLGWAAVGIALAAAGGYLGATPHFRAGHAKGE